MFRPRIIPVLLLKNNALVKSKGFKKYRYIGDPINAVKVFNDLRADELVFLDIDATKEKRTFSAKLVKQVGEEANMPFAVGGGIRSLDDIQNLISWGAEKIIINSYAAENPDFIRQASNDFGSSTIVVCIDVKKKFLGKRVTWTHGATKSTNFSPIDLAKLVEDKGAGEIIIQSIQRDGTMQGYDVELIKEISTSVAIPVVALGGAGGLEDLKQAYTNGYANALAAGSLFVFQGPKKGVLINYIEKSDLSVFR